MKGVQQTAHGGLDELVFRDDIPVPIAGPHDVLVKVSAAGVNNTDLNTRIGWYSKSNNSNDASWSDSPIVFHRIQGEDVCGRVVDVQSVPFYSCACTLKRTSLSPHFLFSTGSVISTRTLFNHVGSKRMVCT
mgnify:FL=1